MPLLVQRHVIAMAHRKKALFCLKADGVSILKRSHSYHCQVQHQLCVTGVQWADFVLWTPTEMIIERIKYDEPFVMANLVKLKAFYFDQLLPALFSTRLSASYARCSMMMSPCNLHKD